MDNPEGKFCDEGFNIEKIMDLLPDLVNYWPSLEIYGDPNHYQNFWRHEWLDPGEQNKLCIFAEQREMFRVLLEIHKRFNFTKIVEGMEINSFYDFIYQLHFCLIVVLQYIYTL